MAVLEDIVLVADGGDLTVGRRAATYVYGSFEVILPDGMEPTESDNRLQDGYIYRPDDSGTGRFDVGFVRADATVDMEAQISDVESVLDAAQKRVEGDVFFERDITTAGLGEYRPGVDFETGDIVSVELWGKRFPSPITAIDYVSSSSEGVGGVRVHAGGQLIADPVALRKQNSSVQKQIASEKARRMREVADIRMELTGTWNGDILDASMGKYGALGRLNQEDIRNEGEVENVRRGIVGQAQDTQFAALTGMDEIAETLRTNFLNQYYTDENGETRNMLTSTELTAAEAGLVPAYVTMNNIMWEQQLLINAVHGDAIEALSQATTRFLWADRKKISQDKWAYIRNPSGTTNVNIQAKAGWTGQIVVIINFNDNLSGEGARIRSYTVTGEGQSWSEYMPLGLAVRNTTLLYRVKTSTDSWYR